MLQESISITKFRFSLTKYCRRVSQGKSELTITHYYESLFKVVQLQGEEGIKASLTDIRDHVSDFLDLLEKHGEIILVGRGKALVRCVKL